MTIEANEAIEKMFYKKHFDQKVLNGFQCFLMQFLTLLTDFQFLRCFTVFVVFMQTIQAIEAF